MGVSCTFHVPAAPWDYQPRTDDEYYATSLFAPRIGHEGANALCELPRQAPPKVMSGFFVLNEDGEFRYGDLTELPPCDGQNVFIVRAADLMTLKDREFVVGEGCLSKRAAWAYFAVCPPETRILVWIDC